MLFVFRQRPRGVERGSRFELPGCDLPAVADFDQVAKQIEKLLTARQLIDLSLRHQRGFYLRHFVDVVAFDFNLFTVL